MFEPLEKKRYSEKIAHMIQERILTEHLESGSRLPAERQLAEELGVSRSVVREAMRMLDGAGYVSIKKGPRGGIFVSQVFHKPISDSLKSLAAHGQITVDHLFDVRLKIEPFMAQEAARHATNEDIKRMHALMAEAGQCLDDATALKQRNIMFHILLAEASGNPVLVMFMKSIADILNEVAYKFLDLSCERVFFSSHRKILKVVADRRADEVLKLVREDILDVRKRLGKALAHV
ncbi:MAG: putative GntR family transcriptional regulator [Deltaproteobacteria bacterium]|jgi:GntR family transcriptional repressor for pyruvate dehydrogenase complex|nr:putative GntR family transcriptional regulator [Deltaproteobacteria bacterium]